MAGKPLTLVLSVALLASAWPARADQAADLAARLKGVRAAVAAVRALDKGTGAALAAEEDTLAATGKQQQAAAGDLIARYTDLQKRAEAAKRLIADHNRLTERLDAQIDEHNKRCADKHADAKACRVEAEAFNGQHNALVADAASLGESVRGLAQEHKDLNAANDALKAKLAQFQKDADRWQADRRAYFAKRRALVAEYAQAVADAQAAAAKVQACVDRLPLKADDKVIKLACGGIPFDDVRVNLKVIAGWPRDTVLELRLE